LPAGEFIDDWIKQKSVSGPSKFESQKRGFVSGGSAHLRWSPSSDYVANVSLPKFERGCGGIDVFMGGIGFLDADYLINKLKLIMGDAGATFFFNIALNTLSEPIAKEIKSLEAIVSRLNAIQLDDCKASQTVVATLDDYAKNGRNAERQALTDFYQESGVNELYQEIVNFGVDNTIQKASSDAGVVKTDMVASCPDCVKNTFFKPGSLLDNLANERGIATGYIDYIRAISGDIDISANLDYKYIPPCDKMTPDNLEAIYNGDLYIRKVTDDTCYAVTSIVVGTNTYTSIADYIGTELLNITTAIINKSSLAPNQIAFIESLPGGIYSGLQNEVLARGNDAIAVDIAAVYTDIASASYTYFILSDLYVMMTKVVKTAEAIVENVNGSQGGTNQKQCQLALKDKPYYQLMEMKDQVRQFIKAVSVDYDAHINRYIAFMEMQMRSYETAQKIKNKSYEGIKRVSNE